MDGKRLIIEETFTNAYNIKNFTIFIKEFFNSCVIVNKEYNNPWNWSEFSYYINGYTHIGNYYDKDKSKIAIFAVELKKKRSVERARSMQRNFVSKLISNAYYDAAIVAFYSKDEPKWRLSLVRLDYEFAKGRAKAKLTPAKRYSYLVGEKEPCHTAMERLLPIFKDDKFNPTLESIEEAFNVEKITEEFFNKYREKYYELKEHLDKNEDFKEEAEKHNFTSEQFAKKLMGQLAFLYFLQKKGWLGVKVLPHVINDKQFKNSYYSYNKAARTLVPKVYKQVTEDKYKLDYNELQRLSDEEANILAGCFKADLWGNGTKTFVRELFNNSSKLQQKKNFFDDYLAPLFYEALNHKRGESNYYKRFNCKIPFLNGGLFEPLENYDWKNSKFKIPDDLFSNKSAKGEDTADGILDIFDRYNFTMNEDEPLEREVAVDPEMLGKIFENLLDVKDRKSKGAFYTPREIVHYMCQESLINYLVNETGISYEDIKAFITYGEIMKDEDICKASKLGTDEMQIPKSVYDNLKLMDDKLADVRIADPAVGSGAFPMGMISEIVKARNNITAYIAAKYVINSNMSDSEKKMLKEQRARIYDMRNPYKLKRDTIKNSIYAVDIEASAVDIAKLRLWLSLVVEEELEPTFDEQVLGIIAQKDPQPLPNLDYNIMCGNSLIDEFEGVKLFDDSVFANRKQPTEVAGVAWQLSLFSDNVETLLQELFKLQDKYFNEDDTERKSEVKKSIDKTIDDIIRAKLLRDSNAAGLEKYDRSLKENTKPYFLWKLEFAKVFKEKGGFDIVIGNPPYLKELDNKNTFDEILRTDFGKKHSESKMNFWYFFFYKGLEVLSNRGNLCFISPNYYITGEGAVKLNQTIINDTTIKIFIDFNKIKVFENADIQCMILLTEKARPQNDAKNGCVFLIRKMFQRDNLLEVINNLTRSKDITYFSITNQRNFLSDDNKINFEFTRFEGILNKLSMKKSGIDIFKTTQGIVENPSTLTKKNIETLISKGIISKEDIGTKYFPKQEFFVISKGKLEGLKLNSEEKMFLRDYHEPSDIARFFYKNETDKKLIYLTKDNIQEIEQFPNLKRHLVHFKPFMDIRRETQKGSNLWFHLHWPRKEELFKREKIIFPQMCDIPKFAYCSQPYYINMSSNLIYKLDKQIDLLVFTGILNSNLAHFWLLHNAKNRGVGLDIGISIMDKFPINKEILTNNSFMRQLVLDIVNARGNNMDISKLELKLNDSVYQIYNINKNEIRIIENYIKERTNIGIRGA